MTENPVKSKKPETFGLLTKSLINFLYMQEEKRRKKYGNDVNKYYERIVKNVNHAIGDVIFAYENLPEEQRKKVDLITNSNILLDYMNDKKIEGRPDQIIQSAKSQLYSIIKSRIRYKPIQKLAEPDFAKVLLWLDGLTPENPLQKGARF